jgi:hypothetical protein
MGVGSNNSHWSQTNDMHFEDHEFEVDEDGEGIVDAPKGRGGNYTNKEDVLLCKTWLEVSRDPSVGGDQSRDAYWNRMKEHFDLRNESGIDRSDRSLRSRWSTINKDCQKWAAAQKAVDKLNPSGTNDEDRVSAKLNPSAISSMFIMLDVGVCSANLFCFYVVEYCTKLVQRRGEEDQEGEDQERKTIYLASLL